MFYYITYQFLSLQSFNLPVYVPDRLSQVLNGLIRVLPSRPADILYGIAEMESQVLVLDEVNDLNFPVIIVVWVVHIVANLL